MYRMFSRVMLSCVTFLVGLSVSFLSAAPEKIAAVTLPHRQISEITYKYQACYESGPDCDAYEVTYFSDGTARYFGNENDDISGHNTGNIGRVRFQTLANQIEAQEFFGLKNEYAPAVRDKRITTTVITNDGSKSVTVYNSDEGPENLWLINSLLDAETYAVVWDDGN